MKINDALLRNLYEEAEEEGKISRKILLENSGREWDVPHAFCNPISNHNSDFCFTVSDLNHQLLLFPKDNLIQVPVPDRKNLTLFFTKKVVNNYTLLGCTYLYSSRKELPPRISCSLTFSEITYKKTSSPFQSGNVALNIKSQA